MVNVDCGSFTPEGVNEIADLCQARFESGDWKVERMIHEPADGEARLGDLVIGRFEGSGGPRVLMVGHMDTVFDPGTVAERPFRIEGDRARGPGVSDMKGGLLTGFFAIEALQEAGFDGFGRITYICNPDEEIGSPWSRDLIKAEATEADAALVLEGARENGDIVSARKGVSDYLIEILGRASHAGVEPERGRSAILEAAHKTVALQGLNGRWPGVTVNVGCGARGHAAERRRRALRDPRRRALAGRGAPRRPPRPRSSASPTRTPSPISRRVLPAASGIARWRRRRAEPSSPRSQPTSRARSGSSSPMRRPAVLRTRTRPPRRARRRSTGSVRSAATITRRRNGST